MGNLAAGYLRRYLKRDEDMLLLVLALLVLSMSTFMLLPLPLPVALCCLGAWGAALGAPAGTVVLASRSGPDKGMVLSFAETFNNIAILASVPLAVRLLELKAARHPVGIGHRPGDRRLAHRAGLVRQPQKRRGAAVARLTASAGAACLPPRARGRRYSTVTDLARLRGWSTSVPLSTATWYESNCNGMV